MSDLEKAKQLLAESGHACVLCRGEEVITEDGRSVSSLLRLLSAGRDLSGFSIADKVIGKAAALLLVKAGIREAYAPVMSREGFRVLQEHRIPAAYDQEVEMIENRDHTDMCPMEKAVQNTEDPEQAFDELTQAAQRMRAAAAAKGGQNR